MLTKTIYDQFKHINVHPDTIDPVDQPTVPIQLGMPPDADTDPLGFSDIQHDKLMLCGDNVLDFVKHYKDANNGRFYFRGESLYSTHLTPSLLRKHNLRRLLDSWGTTDPRELEAALLNRFKRYTWHMFHAESDFAGQQLDFIESLCVAQHHGLPTLLLDWSLNPFIALFFAARYPTRFITKEDKLNPATVWVMKLLPPKGRDDLTIHLEEQQPGAGGDQSPADKKVQISGQRSPLVVVPLSFTRRIDAQSGRFIYCGCMAESQPPVGSPDINLPQVPLRDWKHKKPWVKIDQWVIPAGQRDEVLKQIRILGFHDGKMFPDLKGWANYLQAGHK